MRKEYILILSVLMLLFVTSCNSNNNPLKSIPGSSELPAENDVVQDDNLDTNYFVDEEPCLSYKEICDDVDNDCDKKIDEGIGLCPLSYSCVSGRCVECPLGKSLPEICDGKDNDCDGSVDEDLRDRCGNCINSVRQYPLDYEFCDGKDNDCDGSVDEEEGNECNDFVCRTTSKGDSCDKGVKYKCMNKECVSTKICSEEYSCYWEWVGEQGSYGVTGMKDVRLWLGPKFDGVNTKYYCGDFDTDSQRLLSSCEGSGCVAQLCTGGANCPTACYATLDGSMLHLRKCVNYPGISKICG